MEMEVIIVRLLYNKIQIVTTTKVPQSTLSSS